MVEKADWKRVFLKLRKPWIMTIGGLILGGFGALIFVVLINYVIQPKMSVETRDISEIRGDQFNVWYHEGSPYRTSHAELNRLLEASLDDLLVRLDVEPSAIPLPIDVLVHDDSRQLQTSIAQRKTAAGTHTFYAVLDLMAGEDPYPRMTELVLAFGWGECFSQLLYEGTRRIFVHHDRNHHAAIAAAPVKLRFSVEDLLQLESSGVFAQTIYQQFDSPFSSRLALSSLEGIASFYSAFGSGGIPEEDLESLQAASLVEYLIERYGGIDALREVWGPGSTRALLERLTGEAIEELTSAWWDAAIDQGTASAEYDYYRALYSFEAGSFEEAYRLVEAWNADDLSPAGLALAVRASLAAGAFDEAATWAGAAGGDGQLAEWVALYEGWSRFDDDGLTVLGDLSAAEADTLASEVRAAKTLVASALALTSEQVPAWMTVFCYGDEAGRRAGNGVTPTENSQRTAWHIVSGEDVAWTLASSLPSYAYGIASASNLLQTGLAAVITIPRADLEAAGCEIFLGGNWTPLWQLGFGGVPSSLFRTESGLLIGHVIDEQGLEVVPELWRATARLGGGHSLDSALLEYAGTSRREIEEELLNTVLVCD